MLLEGLLVVIAYGALAVLLLSPLFDDLGGAVLDPERDWLTGFVPHDSNGSMTRAMLRDVHLFVWAYAWDWHALTTQPGALFQANIFHPAPDALAYSEHALAKLPITGPLLALSGNAVFAYQGDLLLTFALSGAALYALLRSVGAARGASFVGGLAYAFCPARLDSLYHTYLLAGQYLPLVLLFLDRTLFGERRRDAVAFGAFLLLQLLSSYYLAYQAVIALTAWLVAVLWTTRGRLPWRGGVRVVVAGAVVGGVFVLVSLPYLRVRSSGAIFGYGGGFAEALIGVSNEPWRNFLVSPLLLRASVVEPLTRGASAYAGLVVLLLALLGLGRVPAEPPPRRRLAAAALAIALAAWALSLGPFLPLDGGRVRLPYWYLMEVLPGFDSMRVPSRFALSMMLGVAVLAGLGVDRLLRVLDGRGARAWSGAATTALLAMLVCADFGLGIERFGTRALRVGVDGPEVYRRLAELPPGPLLELPLPRPDGLRASEAMVHSTTHWMPLLHGSSGYLPPSLPIVTSVARRLPDADALELLGRLTGLRYVVLHRAALTPAQRQRWQDPPGLDLVGRFGTDELYVVADPPAPDLERALRECARSVAACAAVRAVLPS